MSDKVSPFIATNKSWLMRKVIADYLYAKNLFSKLFQDYVAGGEVSFEKMKKFSELLFTAKEDLHLLFKRIGDPHKQSAEESFKFTPNDDEIDFMNNVGLLFHKATVTRELKYMLEYYKTDSDDYKQIKELLDYYVNNMDSLFNVGIEKAKDVLKDSDKNLAVLLYLFENERYVTNAFGKPLKTLLEEILGTEEMDKKINEIGVLCLDSGWPDRAFKIFNRALELNPENDIARQYLEPSFNGE